MTMPVTTARPASPFAPAQPKLTRTKREVPNNPRDINTYDLFVRIAEGPVGAATAKAAQAAKAGDHAGAQAALRQAIAPTLRVADALTIAQTAADLGAARHFWQKDLKAQYAKVAGEALDVAIANARTGADFEAITNVSIKAVNAGGDAKTVIQDREPAIKARQQALVQALRTLPELAGAMADGDLGHAMRGMAVAEAAKRLTSSADAAALVDTLSPYQSEWRRDLAKAGLAKARTLADATALLSTMRDRDESGIATAIGMKAVELVKDMADARRCFEAIDRASFYGQRDVWAALEAKLATMPEAFELRQVVKMKKSR